MMQALYEQGYTIVIFSGRGAIAKTATIMWLARHDCWHHKIRMRDEGDFTPDNELKRKWYEEARWKDDVAFVVDDRQKVVDMWREMGLTCFQVAPGDF